MDAAEISLVAGPVASRISSAKGKPTLSRSNGLREPGLGRVELRLRGNGPIVDAEVDVEVVVDVLMRTGEGAVILVLCRGVAWGSPDEAATVADLRRFSQRIAMMEGWGKRLTDDVRRSYECLCSSVGGARAASCVMRLMLP